MAFRKKAPHILALQPDILIVPECEHTDKIKFKAELPAPSDMLWYGNNAHKGVGVFAFNGFKITLLEAHNPDFRYVLPLCIENERHRFTVFAIWTNNPNDSDGAYITQVWKAIQYYQNLLNLTNTILIGDFNSNTIWDEPNRKGNHSDMVQKLAEKGIRSAYHEYFEQTQGQEAHSTFFMFRHKDRPFHIDYCFASSDLMQVLAKVEVGAFEDWRAHSDHVPLISRFDLEKMSP
jgi:exonuclease III